MSAAIRETNFDLPGQVGEVYHGKVRDVYTIAHGAGDLLVSVCTDRISAFDVVLPEPIPYKGQVLNQMSAELLEATSDTAPNWLIESPDPNVSIGLKAEPFKVEMIMRGFLLGTSWRGYKDGVRDLCGNRLPDGMEEFQPFAKPLLTPTTKAEAGHDENITPQQIIESGQGLATREEFEEMERLAHDLFARGQAMADERGLLLADTKFEFGRLISGEIVVIDEVLTPDSSRFFPAPQYQAYLAGETDRRPEQLSKEFVREDLMKQGFDGQPGQKLPHMTDEFRQEVSERYINLFERMLGHEFVPATAENSKDALDRIRDNITQYLNDLVIA